MPRRRHTFASAAPGVVSSHHRTAIPNVELRSMRSLFTAVSTLLAAIVFCLPASAAARWTCTGAEYVCDKSERAASSASYDVEGRQERRRSAKNTRRETATLDTATERPARRTRRVRNVASDDSDGGYTMSGQASYYWQPQRVASGGWFNPNAMTAAHKTLPFGTRVRVTNQRNGSSVVVTINDRGPYVAGRIIDLSSAAAGVIGMKSSGVAPVRVAVLGRN